MGKLHFWLLPNLTAECGFFESFVPGYEYVFYGDKDKRQEGDSGNENMANDDVTASLPCKENESEENGDWIKVKKTDADVPDVASEQGED